MRVWILTTLLPLVVACSSKNDAPTSDAATGDALTDTIGEDLGDGDAGCGSEPTEGTACTPLGLDCGGYGALSCPEHAICTAAGWRITCPAYAFGTTNPCGCPHPGG